MAIQIPDLKFHVLLLLGLLLPCSAVCAEPFRSAPAPAPAPSPSQSSSEQDRSRFPRFNRFSNPDGAPRFPRLGASEQEWNDISAFMKDHCPNRWHAFESLPENSRIREGVHLFLLGQWNRLQGLKEDDAQLYDVRVKQLKTEDDIFGLLFGKTLAQRQAERPALRAMVKDLVTTGIQERQRRIERMKELLKSEEQKLAYERANPDAVIDRRTASFIDEGPNASRPEPPHHPSPKPDPQER